MACTGRYNRLVHTPPLPAVEGDVAGQRHYSAHRASLLTGSALALGMVGTSAIATPLLGMDPWVLVSLGI